MVLGAFTCGNEYFSDFDANFKVDFQILKLGQPARFSETFVTFKDRR